jgi:hypothetical protein
MSHVASRTVARPPKKPKKGELFRVHVFLPPEVVELVDEVAEKLSADDIGRFTTRATRTEAIRVLLVEALRKRGLLK